MPYITQAQLPDLLRRFENVRFAGDDRGQRKYVDIAAAWYDDEDEGACKYPDCDVRAVLGAGVERQWDGKASVIPWGCIRSITVGDYARDGDGFLQYRPRQIYNVIWEREARAAESYVPGFVA